MAKASPSCRKPLVASPRRRGTARVLSQSRSRSVQASRAERAVPKPVRRVRGTAHASCERASIYGRSSAWALARFRRDVHTRKHRERAPTGPRGAPAGGRDGRQGDDRPRNRRRACAHPPTCYRTVRGQPLLPSAGHSQPGWSRMICPSCGTGNRHDAMFCKYCGFDLAKAPRPAAAQPPAPPPTPSAMPPPPPMAPPPAPMKPRVWWHGLGVFVIVAAFLLFIDLATTARVTWSIAAVLSLAFLIGMIMILQFLASPDRRDRRPFAAGAALLLAAVLLLPVALVFQSSPTTTQTLPSVPFN